MANTAESRVPWNNIEVWGGIRRQFIRNMRPKKWVKASERTPSKEGVYYTRFEEFKGDVDITYYTITSKGGFWSSMYKPSHWSEAVEK